MNENSILDTLIDLALSEDLGEQGDITSKSFIHENSHSIGKIIAKEDCVIAGSEIAESLDFTAVESFILLLVFGLVIVCCCIAAVTAAATTGFSINVPSL